MSVMLAMEGPIGVAFLTMVTVLMVSELTKHTAERERGDGVISSGSPDKCWAVIAAKCLLYDTFCIFSR